MRLDVLGKRNRTSMNLKVHTEVHSFDHKEHLHVPGVGHFWWIRQAQSLCCADLSVWILKLLWGWHSEISNWWFSWASFELKVCCVWHTQSFFSLPLPSSPFSTNKLLILKNEILCTNGRWRSGSSGLAFSMPLAQEVNSVCPFLMGVHLCSSVLFLKPEMFLYFAWLLYRSWESWISDLLLSLPFWIFFDKFFF